jgi:SSS family solute:Na+ symporter
VLAKLEARQALAQDAATLTPEARGELRAKASGDDVLLLLLERYAPLWLAGILSAGIMAAVMATDSQILALSTMFTEDVFAHYEGQARFGEAAQVHTGRVFVIGVTIVAYVIALRLPESIFTVAVQYAFTGFAALSPLLVAALFWRGSTKWGALASTLWVAIGVLGVAAFNTIVAAPPPGQTTAVWSLAGQDVLVRTAGGLVVLGLLPVVPMVLISALLMLVVSALTPKPSAETIARYFPTRG